jgi:hypothetical protein
MSLKKNRNIGLPSIQTNKYTKLYLLITITLIVLCIWQYLYWIYVPKQNEALSKYCSNWCYSHTCNNQLTNLAFLYYKNHPNATKPNAELAKLEIDFYDTTIADCFRDSTTNLNPSILS